MMSLDSKYRDQLIDRAKTILGEALHIMVSEAELSPEEISQLIRNEIQDLLDYYKAPYEVVKGVMDRLRPSSEPTQATLHKYWHDDNMFSSMNTSTISYDEVKKGETVDWLM